MSRYDNIEIKLTNQGKRFKKGVKYPKIPLNEEDIYIYTQEGDRYDILANNYYQKPSLWWIIKLANPTMSSDTLYPTPGTQLRIPSNLGKIISNFNNLNQV